MSNGVAGANIANAAGRPNSGGSAWSAAVIQNAIGEYVRNPTTGDGANKTTANTNYIGVNAFTAYKTNIMHEEENTGAYVESAPYQGLTTAQVDFSAAMNDNTATGGLGQWVTAAGTIAKDGLCNIVAGVATANGAGTNVCRVLTGVVVNDWFWAPVAATS